MELQQIIILRKLRIPLKLTSKILESDNADYAIEVFERNLNEIEDEITALSTIKSIIQSLLKNETFPTMNLNCWMMKTF